VSGTRPGPTHRSRQLAHLALVLLVVLLGTLGPGPTTADGVERRGGPAAIPPVGQAGTPESGLLVSMDSIVPAYLTPGEPVAVGGSITNLDDHVWRDLQVYLVMSSNPMTTREQLAAALASPATLYSGERVTAPGFYLELGALEPGESVPYQLEVPFGRLGLLSRAPGVYSLGVHVIATDEAGVRNPYEATGRARSFIPFIPEPVASPVDISVLWPVQAHVQRAGDGGYVNADLLAADVSNGGRLRRVLDMAQAAGPVPLTVVADPAVLDAVAHIADGTTCQAGQRPGTTEAQPSPLAVESSQQASAREFLRDFVALASAQTLWTQGYGRPDLTALGSYRGPRLHNAIEAATSATLDALGLSGRRVYLPTQGLDAKTLSKLGPDTVTVVAGEQVLDWDLEDGPLAEVQPAGREPFVIVVADRTLTDGGPAPGPTDTALQVRQRLLSESALLALQASATGVAAPGILFVASPSWDPGATWPASGFFSGFSAPWLRPVPVDDQLTSPPPEVPSVVPAGGPGQPLPQSLLNTASDISRRARVLSSITSSETDLSICHDQAAALAASEYWRSDPATGQQLADQALADVTRQLQQITIEGPDFVTLSSDSGRFPITITNGLDEPVRVGVRITADDDSLAFDEIEPVELRRGDSTTFTVRTSAADVGVVAVTARLTTPEGRAFGQPATFSLRTSVVGVVVWVALGTAAALVALAIARRLRRRGRGRAVAPAPAPVRTAP